MSKNKWQVGDAVQVIHGESGRRVGAGLVLHTKDDGWVGVRLEGELGWDEWPGEWLLPVGVMPN